MNWFDGKSCLKKRVTGVDSVFSDNEQGEVSRKKSNESCGWRKSVGNAVDVVINMYFVPHLLAALWVPTWPVN